MSKREGVGLASELFVLGDHIRLTSLGLSKPRLARSPRGVVKGFSETNPYVVLVGRVGEPEDQLFSCEYWELDEEYREEKKPAALASVAPVAPSLPIPTVSVRLPSPPPLRPLVKEPFQEGMVEVRLKVTDSQQRVVRIPPVGPSSSREPRLVPGPQPVPRVTPVANRRKLVLVPELSCKQERREEAREKELPWIWRGKTRGNDPLK